MNRLVKSLLSAFFALAVGGAPFAAQAATVQVDNETGGSIALVYVSPNWSSIFRQSDQILGADQYIEPGQTWTLEFQGGNICVFDLKAVFVDGATIERDNVNLCEPTIWTISP